MFAMDGLIPCAHCEGEALFLAGRLEAIVTCAECGISTPPCAMDEGQDAVFARLQAIWNTRADHRPTDKHKIAALARQELTTSDLPYFLNLLAANNGDWDTQGPIFAAMAARLAQPETRLQTLLPVAPVLEDAGRYRKLVRRARLIRIDGKPWIRIDPFEATVAELMDEDREGLGLIEDLVSNAVDQLPAAAP